jgi:predicted transcriptional regulator
MQDLFKSIQMNFNLPDSINSLSKLLVFIFIAENTILTLNEIKVENLRIKTIKSFISEMLNEKLISKKVQLIKLTTKGEKVIEELKSSIYYLMLVNHFSDSTLMRVKIETFQEIQEY